MEQFLAILSAVWQESGILWQTCSGVYPHLRAGACGHSPTGKVFLICEWCLTLLTLEKAMKPFSDLKLVFSVSSQRLGRQKFEIIIQSGCSHTADTHKAVIVTQQTHTQVAIVTQLTRKVAVATWLTHIQVLSWLVSLKSTLSWIPKSDKKGDTQGCSNGPVVKNTCSSSREAKFSSEHPH